MAMMMSVPDQQLLAYPSANPDYRNSWPELTGERAPIRV
jgi:hypothetical protein